MSLNVDAENFQTFIKELIKLTELVMCSACLDIVKNSVQLQCKHILCTDCIAILRKAEYLQCPLCAEILRVKKYISYKIEHLTKITRDISDLDMELIGKASSKLKVLQKLKKDFTSPEEHSDQQELEVPVVTHNKERKIRLKVAQWLINNKKDADLRLELLQNHLVKDSTQVDWEYPLLQNHLVKDSTQVDWEYPETDIEELSDISSYERRTASRGILLTTSSSSSRQSLASSSLDFEKIRIKKGMQERELKELKKSEDFKNMCMPIAQKTCSKVRSSEVKSKEQTGSEIKVLRNILVCEELSTTVPEIPCDLKVNNNDMFSSEYEDPGIVEPSQKQSSSWYASQCQRIKDKLSFLLSNSSSNELRTTPPKDTEVKDETLKKTTSLPKENIDSSPSPLKKSLHISTIRTERKPLYPLDLEQNSRFSPLGIMPKLQKVVTFTTPKQESRLNCIQTSHDIPVNTLQQINPAREPCIACAKPTTKQLATVHSVNDLGYQQE